MNKTENFTPRFICVLHTFGRDLKCNGSSLKRFKNEMYAKHFDCFYVRAKPNYCTPDKTIKYIRMPFFISIPLYTVFHFEEFPIK